MKMYLIKSIWNKLKFSKFTKKYAYLSIIFACKTLV